MNRMPRMPPSSELRKMLMKSAVMSGYLACRIYSAGKVKMAPATTLPEHAPMLWMMTFSPNAPLRLATVETPTAMMAIGMAASKTWPTFRPR